MAYQQTECVQKSLLKQALKLFSQSVEGLLKVNQANVAVQEQPQRLICSGKN